MGISKDATVEEVEVGADEEEEEESKKILDYQFLKIIFIYRKRKN